ncbi:MAG: single-stranded-DNA-specific exonuclease RecJ [Candidatus Omnitrophota bacterium]|nr:MAG: single-stranded-DNA-specific exonuclease RecJ [Candidatus Omnitrophota bacterium]
MKRKLWNIKELTPKTYKLAKRFRISPVLIQVLFNRQISEDDFQSFLYPVLINLHPAHLLPDIERAVQRIKAATENKEKVFVVGDFDVDGITSLAIFHEYAKDFSDKFCFYIPHRVKEGYGLSKKCVQEAKKEGASLIIAFDCGTNAYEALSFAASSRIDVIVVDHHHCQESRIKPFALINPKRKDSSYPFRELSTAALSFKLLQLLKKSSCAKMLDLVALSLICDVVPLTGENRILLREGLKLIKSTSRLAIKALCDVSKLKQKNIDTFHIGYILGPRINASGRVAHAKDALDIFLSNDNTKVYELAAKLGKYNQLRKGIEAGILKEAEASAQKSVLSEDGAIVVANDGWHPGVLGIVASRLADKYYRPTFVISFEEELGRGSGRSIHSVHLMDMLKECADCLHLYGGHQKAAGIHIRRDQIKTFKEKLNYFMKENVKAQDLVPVLEVDCAIDFEDITMALIEQLQLLKPFGEGNPQPHFASFNIRKKTLPQKSNSGYSVWFDNGHLTFEATVYDKDFLELLDYGERFDIVYTLERNSFYNIPRLIVRDLRLAAGEG